MPDEGEHAALVDTWLKRAAAKERSAEALLQLFDAALSALLARTRTTLGEVTLSAIAGRVLYNTAEKYPLFSALTVEATGGIEVRELLEQVASVHESDLKEGFRFLLLELLTVLGNLTAGILTPDLHSELRKVTLANSARAGKGGQRSPTSPRGKAREKKS